MNLWYSQNGCLSHDKGLMCSNLVLIKIKKKMGISYALISRVFLSKPYDANGNDDYM